MSLLTPFGILSPVLRMELLAGGRIHRTYRVETADGCYIAQQLNTAVFPDPELVMENIARVTAHIRTRCPSQETLHFYRTADGGFLHDGWRVMDAIRGIPLDPEAGAATIRAAGEAFGQFLTLLSDLPPASLREPIPGFHDTPAHFAALDAAARADVLGRGKTAAPYLRRLEALREGACRLCRSDLPRRIVHGDTKCANILIDPQTHRPRAVIDLDTVMPGLAAYDFGDAVRSLCGKDLDLAKYRAFLDGYLAGAACLTERERQTLPLGVGSVTAELAARYLTAYLTGQGALSKPDALQRAEELLGLAEQGGRFSA